MRFALLFIVIPVAAWAEPIKLTGKEVRELLTGNTAIGVWVDHEYRQWFTDGGTTYYAPKNGRSSRGRWRVNDATHEYESEWNESGYWEGYPIFRDGDQLFWEAEGIPPQPFVMVEGEALVWPNDDEN